MIPTGNTRLAGIIGWPVSHSRSPRLHNYWLERYCIDGAYVPLPVEPTHLAVAIKGLIGLGFVGANVTVPHKESVIALLDEIEPSARRLGAVNIITVDSAGRLRGDNTDGFGFIENLRQGAPEWRAQGCVAAILGAGGAARGVAAALLASGAAEIRLINRTTARAEAVAADLAGLGEGVSHAILWDQRALGLENVGLLVNATTLGMTGNPALDLDLGGLATDAIVTDLVYQPVLTPLLEAAAGRGNPVVDGIGMLLHQARPSFRAWFGVEPEVTPALRAHVLADPDA